jgi:hypothetical protein
MVNSAVNWTLPGAVVYPFVAVKSHFAYNV